MLLAIRERVMGIVGWVLLGILAVAFAFFGLNSYLGDNATAYAVSVNGVEISLGAAQRAYQNSLSRLQTRMGESFDLASIDEDALRKMALEELINEQLLLQEVDAEGFAISKEQLASRISSVDAFKQDDAFSSARYESILRNQGLSPSEFEWRLSREMLTQQLLTGILQTAEATPDMAGKIYRLQAQQRRFRYLTFPVSIYQDKVTVSDAEIESHYRENSRSFMSPERIKLQYVELIADDLEVDIEVDDETLQALYDEQLENYVTGEQRQARHILVSIPPDSDKEAVEKLRIEAQLILERLEKGEAFSEIAKNESDDPGSKASGGDLGFFGKGVMAPEFEEAVFTLDKGERSTIVQTTFGFHIIEVTGIKPEIVTPFEDVRDELVRDYLAEARDDLFYEYSDLLANAAFENPDSLDSAASELDLEISTSEWLTRGGGPGIGTYPEIIAAAFQRDVLESGNNSEPVEVADNHQVVIRLLEHEPAEARPLDAVRDEITRKLHERKVREMARSEGEQLLQELRAGASLDELTANRELEVADSGLINRASREPEIQLVQQAYRMPKPADGAASVAGIALGNGDYVVISLEDIQDGVFEGQSETDRTYVTREISAIQGRSEAAALVGALKASAVIIIPGQDKQDRLP